MVLRYTITAVQKTSITRDGPQVYYHIQKTSITRDGPQVYYHIQKTSIARDGPQVYYHIQKTSLTRDGPQVYYHSCTENFTNKRWSSCILSDSCKFILQYINEFVGNWIWYNYLCNECLSPLKLWVRIPLRRVVLVATLCDKVVSGFLWFPPPIKLAATI